MTLLGHVKLQLATKRREVLARWLLECVAVRSWRSTGSGARTAGTKEEAMAIKSLDEKMLHEVGDIYDAEHQFLEAMQQMQGQAQSNEVKSLLKQHIGETEQQITNLEQVFQALGEKPKREKCAGAAGLVSEAQKLLKEVKDNPQLIDLAIAGSQSKSEHYEISAYRGLITAAEEMGQGEIVKLLQKNLQQEEQTAQKVEQSTPKLLQQAMKAQERGA
jgi:ferritin-like metal-binding protein YciE